MNTYERLLTEVQEENIIIDENSSSLIDGEEGYYVEFASKKLILINENVKCIKKRKCILAEEMGHYFTSSGNILNQTDAGNAKQESVARRWSVKKLIRVEDLLDAFDLGVRNKHELAEHLEVTEEFLDMALEHFGRIYGYSHTIGKHTILFNPLCIYKNIE